MPDSEYGIVPAFRAAEFVWIKRRLGIDMLAIDEEIIELPNLIQQAGEYTAEAANAQEMAENELKSVMALVAEQLRAKKNIHGKNRSETQIGTELPASPEVKEHQDIVAKARLDAKLWSILMESLRKKDSGIRTIADLLNSGFLTTATIMEKRRKEIRQVKVELSP